VAEPMVGIKYFAFLNGRLGVRSCDSCSVHVTMPRPTPETLEGFYSAPNSSYRFHKPEGSSDPNLWLERITNPKYKNWLDFGCGWGALVEEARDWGYDARGVELGDLARASLSARGLSAYASLAECRAAGFSADVVSLIHVLEHIAYPRPLLREIDSLLNPKGVLIIEVPNLKSIRSRMGVFFPKKRYPNAERYCAFPIHLVYYTIETLRQLLRSCGYEIVTTGAHGFGLEIFERPAGNTAGGPGGPSPQVARPPRSPDRPKNLRFLRSATKKLLSQTHLGEHIYVVARPLRH
jgi:SAM-dependent methyltransferase